jgi:DNA replication protein DnaC
VTDGAGDPDCPICHGVGYVRHDYPVGHPNFGKLETCICQLDNLQLERAAQLRAESNTEVLAGKTFDTFLPEGINPDPEIRASLRFAYDRCRAFAEKPEHWLLLTGTYGCGKTHLAAAIANRCLSEGKPVLFLNTPDLLDYLRAAFSPTSGTTYNERFEEIRTVPILILDDLGTESPTNWASEKLYQIINHRFNARLPTVITTNKDVKDMDPRIGSRLSDVELVTPFNILAPDYRSGKPSLTSDISTLAVHHYQTFETFDLRVELTGETRQNFLRAIGAAKEFAEDPHGWLVLTGPFGSGKTHLAAAMANYRSQAGKPVIFVTFQDITDLSRTTGNRESDERNAKLLQQVKNTEFLVIDDLPSLASVSGYVREKFFQLFTYRFDARLPTVLTTAAEEKELDARIKSRIFYTDYCQVHSLEVGPYRGKKKTAAGRKH